jgi:tetratricopeptide (TPR) repeat protein
MTPDASARLDLLLGLRRFREAEALARECLAAEPDRADRHVQLARALAGQDRAAEALESARSAAAREPDNPWVLANLAWVLTQEPIKRPGEALDVLQHALRVDPNYSWAYELVALASLMLGRQDEQLAAARKAVELAPEKESSWVQLGWAQAKQNRYREAIEAAETGLRLHPESAALHHLRGRCLTFQGILTRRPRRFRAFRMAHESLREAVRLDPGVLTPTDSLLLNAVAWRRAAYRAGLAVTLGVLAVGGCVIGYRMIGPPALLAVALWGLFVYRLRKPLFKPPTYGLSLLPLGWAGFPDVPLAARPRTPGRRGWLLRVCLLAILLATPVLRLTTAGAGLAMILLVVQAIGNLTTASR